VIVTDRTVDVTIARIGRNWERWVI